LKADADGATDIEDFDRLMKEMENLEANNSVNDHPLEVGLVLGSRSVDNSFTNLTVLLNLIQI
jgi:hypothetical protein